MKHSMSSFVLILIVVLFASLNPAAAQEVIIEPPTPGVFTDPLWLQVDYHRVNVEITDQIATTSIDLQFTNAGDALAEGTFIFPLPADVTVDSLTMFINGEAFEANVLDAQEARSVYDEIVRQYRDPALLEYIGTGAIQANVFPIPPGESRGIQVTYSQVLEVDNGLVQYGYPVTNDRFAEKMNISVNVQSNDPISSIYSPTHEIAVFREGENGFRAGWEATTSTLQTEDFTLFYGIASDTINLNLLTYRESANEDGFFMLLVQPPVEAAVETVVPKDVIVVLDQSGSMDGEKWDQARAAVTYVLQNLNPEDRFNVIMFSSGYRLYSETMLPASDAGAAVEWVNAAIAEGGTDINIALTNALALVGERPATVLFLTDGEATEGVIETQDILANLQAADKPNARIFSFGVGDDVNTVLLDAIVRDFRGTGTYVRPEQRIDEAVASLYNKVNAPVLTDIAIDFGGVQTELRYPEQLSDLFAGEQLTIVGRYRDGAEGVTLTLTGTVNGQQQSYAYSSQAFRDTAGGEAFIARLWATRRIANLLNTIRINGENPELVDSIVELSVRYGIITPYTSFLITEDDILTQQGLAEAQESARSAVGDLAEQTTGAGAVDAAAQIADLEAAEEAPVFAPLPTQAATSVTGGAGDDAGSTFNSVTEDDMAVSPAEVAPETNPIQTVEGKTFVQQDGVWTDTQFSPDTMQTQQVTFLSDAYFQLLEEKPELAAYFAMGDQVIVVLEDVAYEVVPEA